MGAANPAHMSVGLFYLGATRPNWGNVEDITLLSAPLRIPENIPTIVWLAKTRALHKLKSIFESVQHSKSRWFSYYHETTIIGGRRATPELVGPHGTRGPRSPPWSSDAGVPLGERSPGPFRLVRLFCFTDGPPNHYR